MKYKEKISNRQLIHGILEAAMDIQNMGIGTVFVNLSGHIRDIRVSVYIPEWHENTGPTYTSDHPDHYHVTDKGERLSEIIEELEAIVKEHGEPASISDN